MTRPLAFVCALVGIASVTGCDKAPTPETAPSAAAASAPKDPNTKQYGAALTLEKPVELADVLAKPDAFKGKTVLVDGEVRKACTRKGCWMEIAASMAPDAPGCRVTFKDYGFFVPLDSAGAKARVEGVVEVEVVKKAHVEHMEEEGASFAQKNPDGTANEVRVVATGVQLTKS